MIKVGCCGVPVGWQKYVKEFNLVEVQKTFYQPPRDRAITHWRQKVPDNFEFTIKAWQVITHPSSSPTYRRIQEELDLAKAGFFQNSKVVRYAYSRIVKVAEILKSKIILFQTPPSFISSKQNIKNLKYFFTEITQKKFIHIWEPRGKWNWEEIKKLSRESNIYIAVDPFKVKPFSQKIIYFRLHGKGGYKYNYQKSELIELVNLINELDYDICYVLFNNVYMWESALKFKQLI